MEQVALWNGEIQALDTSVVDAEKNLVLRRCVDWEASQDTSCGRIPCCSKTAQMQTSEDWVFHLLDLIFGLWL